MHPGKAGETRDVPTWAPVVAYARAIQIGEQLSALAIRSGDTLSWRGLLTSEIDTPPRVSTLHADFFDGSSGIGLFLLALARKTGRADLREVGLQSLGALRRHLTAPNDTRRRVLGGAEGLASCLYPLVVGATLADRADLLDVAERVAETVTDDVIAADQQFDLLAGSAGTILGLLALHHGGREIGLHKALACGRHLLAHRPPPSSRTSTVRPAGLARGASGYALALARLGDASGDATFLDAAASWVAYEDSLFDRTYGNWPDYGAPPYERREADFALCSWTRGATGIGFARLAMPRSTGLDMTRAIRRTITEPLSELDDLCCGNFGRIAFLLEAGVRLERPELVAQARARAAKRLATRISDFPAVIGNARQNLGFFRGAAGVGYELLRLVDPHLYPCALLWDSTPGATQQRSRI